MDPLSHYNLETVLVNQMQRFKNSKPGINRRINFLQYVNHPQIIVITGVRRCGKSTLLRQLADFFPSYLYVNLDDERFAGIGIHHLTEIMTIFEENQPGIRTIFLDEIQNIPEWERFVRRIHDDGYQVFLTGSNAQLLSSELGTRLTGRYVTISLWPFRFDEYSNIMGVSEFPQGTEAEAEIQRLFIRYLEEGGFPGFLQYQDPEILHQIFEDIIYRDIIVRYGIREILPFRELCRYIYSNLTREASYQSLAKSIGVKNAMTIRSWIGYLQDSFLISECFRFDYSLRRQHAYHKKMYGIDTGLRNTVSFRFSGDTGMLFEQAVWMEYKSRGYDLFWFKAEGECDFLVFDSGKIITCIQACTELTLENQEREVSGLLKAMKEMRCDDGVILTLRQYQEMVIEGMRIKIRPFWNVILTDSPLIKKSKW